MSGKNILFIGCGNMGRVLLDVLLKKDDGDSFTVVDKLGGGGRFSGVSYVADFAQIVEGASFDLVFLCVKPQDSIKALESLRACNFCNQNTIYVSIIAGKMVSFFEKVLGADAKIVRSMPNMAIKTGHGIFPYFVSSAITGSDLGFLADYFTSFGVSFEVQDEKSFGILTAIFGCGPAYIFLLQQIFTQIAVENSIDRDLASTLVKSMFLGAAKMSDEDSANFSQLKSAVTSKGGVTESALEVLESQTELYQLFNKAIKAAIKKGRDLSE